MRYTRIDAQRSVHQTVGTETHDENSGKYCNDVYFFFYHIHIKDKLAMSGVQGILNIDHNTIVNYPDALVMQPYGGHRTDGRCGDFIPTDKSGNNCAINFSNEVACTITTSSGKTIAPVDAPDNKMPYLGSETFMGTCNYPPNALTTPGDWNAFEQKFIKPSWQQVDQGVNAITTDDVAANAKAYNDAMKNLCTTFGTTNCRDYSAYAGLSTFQFGGRLHNVHATRRRC